MANTATVDNVMKALHFDKLGNADAVRGAIKDVPEEELSGFLTRYNEGRAKSKPDSPTVAALDAFRFNRDSNGVLDKAILSAFDLATQDPAALNEDWLWVQQSAIAHFAKDNDFKNVGWKEYLHLGDSRAYIVQNKTDNEGWNNKLARQSAAPSPPPTATPPTATPPTATPPTATPPTATPPTATPPTATPPTGTPPTGTPPTPPETSINAALAPTAQNGFDVGDLKNPVYQGMKETHFVTNGDGIDEENQKAIDDNAKILIPALANDRSLRVRVTGHTSTTGPAGNTWQFNKELSDRRANALKNAYIKAGVPADRIDTVGASYDQKEVPDPPQTENAMNRSATTTLSTSGPAPIQAPAPYQQAPIAGLQQPAFAAIQQPPGTYVPLWAVPVAIGGTAVLVESGHGHRIGPKWLGLNTGLHAPHHEDDHFPQRAQNPNRRGELVGNMFYVPGNDVVRRPGWGGVQHPGNNVRH